MKKYEISEEQVKAIIGVLSEVPAKLSYNAITVLSQLKEVNCEPPDVKVG